MRTTEDIVAASVAAPTCFTRQEPIAAYLARADYVSSSTLRRFARGIAQPQQGFVADGRERLPQALHAAVLEPKRFESDYLLLDRLPVEELKQAPQLLERIWLSSGEHAALAAMRKCIISHPRWPLAHWLDTGMRELSIYWSDALGRRWKARPDCFNPDIVLELKTTQDVRPRAFVHTRRRYGYDLQAAQYVDAVHELTGSTPRFAFIAIEPQPPHYVWVHELSEPELERARVELEAARMRYCAS